MGLALLLLLLRPSPIRAGGPLAVGGDATGGFGPEGQPFVWMTLPVPYTTDGGSVGVRDNDTANASVAAMFQVWEDAPTSTLAFTRTGGINAALVPDGDVDTIAEFNAIGCNGNPIIYDADGSLFSDLGVAPGVVGFAGFCSLSNVGAIGSGRAVLNGDFRDGDSIDGFELSDNEFDAVFIHEFGHFLGLDHSQINVNCLTGFASCSSGSDDASGLPTMFPLLLSGLTETPGVHPARTLSTDDVAWVSFLYPESDFTASTGTITGSVFYSDGQTGVQGANVIARQVDDPATPAIDESRRNAVSGVSGYLFTGNPGNSLVSNPRDSLGSTNATVKGSYRIPGLPVPANPTAYQIEVESIDPDFTLGSSVGPLLFPIPLPGPEEFFGGPESASDDPTVAENINVTAGITESGKNIILNSTASTFDSFDAVSRNESRDTASAIGNGTWRASLSPFPDQDFYSIQATAGTTVTVGNPDPTPDAFDDVCANDDIDLGVVQDSKLEFSPSSSSTYFLHVSEFRGDARPDFLYDLMVSGAGTGGANNPLPTLTSLSPSSVLAGGTSFTLTLNGTNFVSGSIVRWNGSNRTTTFVSSTQLQASIPPSDIALAGSAQVTVFNPAPGGGTSFALTFTIAVVSNPIPSGAFQTIIPHSAFGGGFLSRLFISNLTNNTNTLTINRIGQGGTVVDTTGVTLQPAGTLLIADSEDRRTQDLTIEWFAIGSERPIAASVLFDFDSEMFGLEENFRTTVGALAADPLTAFTAPVRVSTEDPVANEDTTIGVALANLSGASNTIDMKLLDQQGAIAAQDSVTLGPYAQTAFRLRDRAALRDVLLGGPEFIGALAVTTADPSQSIAALVVGTNLRQLFSLPVSSGVAK
jgi:hypothetical protein